MYKQYKDHTGDVVTGCIIRMFDSWNNPTPNSVCIPFDPKNRDYQEYLKWLAIGNTPLPADD